MSIVKFSVTQPNPTRPDLPITNKILTRPDHNMMMPKGEFENTILTSSKLLHLYSTSSSAIAETALQNGLVLKKWKTGGETIFCRYYRSIFNHCDVISLQTCKAIKFGVKMQNKGYYAFQDHSRSVSIKSPYVTSCTVRPDSQVNQAVDISV